MKPIRVKQRISEDIEDLLDSAIDMDQLILAETDGLDFSGDRAELRRQLEKIRSQVVRNATLLEGIHVKLNQG